MSPPSSDRFTEKTGQIDEAAISATPVSTILTPNDCSNVVDWFVGQFDEAIGCLDGREYQSLEEILSTLRTVFAELREPQ